MKKKLKSLTKTEDKKRLLSNFFSLSVLQIFSYILPLLTLPYLVRVLGVETFGLVSFAAAFITFFNILVDYGFNLSATREVSVHRENKDKITEIYSSVLTIKFILILVSLVVFSFIVFTFDKFSSHMELYFVTFISVIGQALFPLWFFQGMERMKYITIINISSRVIFTIALFVFVHQESDYLLVPLLNGLGIVIGSLYALYRVKKDFNQSFVLQSIDTMKLHFKDSSQFFLSRVSVSLYTSANAFVLGLFTNNTMVGYYSIAEKLYMAMQSLYGPITQALYPYVAKEKNIKLFKKIFYSVVGLNILGVVFLYFFGEYIFAFLFTKEIGMESISVFKIFLLANLIVVPSILMGYPLLGALGFSQYANMSVITGSILHLMGLFLLVITNTITIYSVASMVIITELSVLGVRTFWIKENRLWQK